MSAIRVKIFATQFGVLQSIHVSQDNQIPIEMELVDYSIPANAQIIAYARGRFSGKTYQKSCTYDGNVITFTPSTGFFTPGSNFLQVEINGKIIPFYIEAICAERISTAGNPTTPEPVIPYVERAETAANLADGYMKDAAGNATKAKSSEEAAKTARIEAERAAETARDNANAALNAAKATTLANEAAIAALKETKASEEAAALSATKTGDMLSEVEEFARTATKAKDNAEAACIAAEEYQTEAKKSEESAKKYAESVASTVDDINAAKESALDEIKTAAENINVAKGTALDEINTAKEACKAEIREKTDQCLAEIPETYTKITADVTEMKAQLALNSQWLDNYYHKKILKAQNVQNVDLLFAEWWKFVNDGVATNAELIGRWFTNVMFDDRVHGVKFPLFDTSTSAIGELTDDSSELSCTPSTATVAGQDDFAHLPQFWALEVSMERNADGSHTINKVEHIDPIAEVRSGNYGMCQVLQKNTYTKEWTADGYHYLQMACDPVDKTGWNTWPQGTDRNGHVYPYMANPKYYAGLGSNGIPTSGTGLLTMNYTSHNAGVTAWRKRGSQYSGASGSLLKFQLRMMWLKYARKGNSGTIEGCSNFSCRYTAAVGETAVERIVVTTAQGANLLVGCNVHIGTSKEGYQIARDVTVTKLEPVTINGTDYTAVYVDNKGTTFDTVADTTYISTMPWKSGRNDVVLGYDGSYTNYTNGKEPGLIQRTEFQNGAYMILSDELWQWGTDADGNYQLDCYTCHDQSKVTTNGSISADYTKQEDLTLTFASGSKSGWHYIEDIAVSEDPGVIWPAKVSTAAGSGTGVKAAMYVGLASSGVRAAWCCYNLDGGGYCGLAARCSLHGTAGGLWFGSVGCPSGISG